MSTSDPGRPERPERPGPTADDLFGAGEPIRSADDLARDGVFDDGEVEDFLADLYAMRRSEVA
ncbi:hypothetical protein [Pseudonocardia lacus]|uniref:hypothetical protein n=1 Tax=Pseudonocardia lacus TaxID=2835865 RepID=UPI001BDD018A|nr:hypothetical protein [Pseudonocardia lacus]